MVVTLLILVVMVVGIFILMRKKIDNLETIEIMEKDNIEGSVSLIICNISKPEAISGQNSFETGQTTLISKNKGTGVDLMLLNNTKGVFRLSIIMKAAA